MRRIETYALLLFIIVLLVFGVFFRCTNLDRKIYWYDETRTSLRAIAAYKPSDLKEVFDNRITGIQDLQKYQQVEPQRSLIKSIAVMADDDPKHPPLYFVLVGFWARLWGDSVGTVRALSAMISLLAFPCFYWLGLELFGSQLTAAVATSLMAVSPFHVLYAQEAREYSLWTVTTLLASAALLRAIRLQTKLSWITYGLAVGLGIYSHTLFVLVITAHAVYVVGSTQKQLIYSKSRKIASKQLRLLIGWQSYLLATLLGLATFAPWAKFIIAKRNGLRTEFLAEPVDFSYLLKHWILSLSSIFFDPNGSVFLDVKDRIDSPLTYLIRLPILVLVGYSLYYLCSKTPRQIWLLILSLIGVTALALILPDLILGGKRSSFPRYLIPCYLGIQMAVAYLLTKRSFTGSVSYQKLWQTLWALLITVGIVSCAISSQAEAWWNQSASYYNPQVAHIINQSANPIVVCNYSWYNSTQLLSLSHLLEPKVRLLLLAEPDISLISQRFSHNKDSIFLLNPAEKLQQELDQEGYKIEPIHARGQLWRLEKQEEINFGVLSSQVVDNSSQRV